MTYRVLIFNDSKWRDLPGSIFLKKSLEESLPDSLIQICSFHAWQETIGHFCPHLVILNNAQGKRNQHIASYIKRHGGVVVVLFTEGLVVTEDFSQVFEAQKDNRDVDLFLCWNDIVSGLTGGVTVGCPRFDVYNKPELIDSKAFFCDKWNLDPNKKIVLFGDSWPSAKFTYTKMAFNRKDWKQTGAGKWIPSEQFAQQEHEGQSRFKAMISTLRNFHLDDDIQIVVKGHPMSDYMEWQKWGEKNGVLVIHSAYSFNALNACDLYISKIGSITVVEAWLLNKPSIKLTGYTTSSALGQFEADKLNLDWTSLEDLNILALTISSLLGAKVDEFMEYENKARDAHLRKWGLKNDDATGATASELLKLLANTDFSLRYEPDLREFFNIVARYDRLYSQSIMDEFGNWNKATYQKDIRTWNV